MRRTVDGQRTYGSCDEAFVDVTRSVAELGQPSSPRGIPTREVMGLSFVVTDPRDRIVCARELRLGYCAAKLMWDLSGRNDLASIARWNPNGARYSDDGEWLRGENYGQRIDCYLGEALELLKLDPETRRAWVPVWHPEDLLGNELPEVHAGGFEDVRTRYSREGKNVPCTLGFCLRLVEGVLDMQCVMRSQSLYGVLPYDLYWATAMQELIANELDADLGRYEHHMLSAHVYERELDVVRGLGEPVSGRPMSPCVHGLVDLMPTYRHWFDRLTDDPSPLKDDEVRFIETLDDPHLTLMVENRPGEEG